MICLLILLFGILFGIFWGNETIKDNKHLNYIDNGIIFASAYMKVPNRLHLRNPF